MKKSKFSLAHKDEVLVSLVGETDQKILARWAIDCAERVMPYFAKQYPKDRRPQQALATLKAWIKTGVFTMAVIRKASLDSHAAAREIGEDNAARHAYGAAIYAQQAIYRAVGVSEANSAVTAERNWQYQHLVDLISKMRSKK
ncbi:MAG: hypothetical protein UW32_C0001G0345 [Candidatus Wolfebacteria bacterium GW2011_GWE2_44_13]|uniref:Imm-5-like domain-containing protein n=1 Tax=Candidatus Wolfebacteria bacterium GW2011_GWE2_44_13 TaxID=1619017 RepID=A0A0G1HB52_9BACT|nr:MAG: hypothetical protein UW32_C0001G0345 [Candidatus Wolfebacteria bacterium GW2011_GWE2_44_13]